MLNKWAIFTAVIMHGCGASTPIQPKSLTDASQSLVTLSAFEGKRTSKFTGVMELEVTCSISLLPTATEKFWVFSQIGDGADCAPSRVVVDTHGTVIRYDYAAMAHALGQTGDWASTEIMLGVAKFSDVRIMRLAVPSPIVRRAPVGESVADVDRQPTSIRKEVTKDGLVLRTKNHSSALPPFTLVEEQYGVIPAGDTWIKEGSYEVTAVELEEANSKQEVFNEYLATKATAKICEEGDPVECSVQAVAALELGERAMARRLVEAGCSQNDSESCALLGLYKRQGIGGKAVETAALVDLEKGCELGSGAGCFGASLSSKLVQPSRNAMVEKGCVLGYAQACAIIGRNLAHAGDVKEGLKTMQAACDKDFLSCDILFESQIKFQEGPAQVQGAENLAKLCPTKWQACEKALRFPDLLDEESLEEVEVVEREVSAKACGQGEAAACYRQGTLFLDGVGGEVETSKGLDFRRKACEMADYLCEKSSDK